MLHYVVVIEGEGAKITYHGPFTNDIRATSYGVKMERAGKGLFITTLPVQPIDEEVE